MKLHDLQPAPGSNRRRKRVGRGIGGKGGKTAGRGTKGQKARGTIPARFEGGQNPLHTRVPKLRGFNNPFRLDFAEVNLWRLEQAVEAGKLKRVGSGIKVRHVAEVLAGDYETPPIAEAE